MSRGKIKELILVCSIVLSLLLGVCLPAAVPPEIDIDEISRRIVALHEDAGDVDADASDGDAISFGVGIPPDVFRAIRVESTLAVDGDTILSGDLSVGGAIDVDEINGGYIDFDTTSGDPGYQQGRMFWDTNDETVAVHVNNGTDQVTLQLGQEQHVLVRNDTGSDWANGAVGIATGSVGYRPTAILANATYITTAGGQGMATQAIAKNTSGVATTFGLVRGVDTSDYDEGDLLYISASASGTLTNTPPSVGYNVIFGRVLRSHPNDGIIFVNPRQLPYHGDLAGGNYVDWDFEGQMRAHGDARWWDDIRVAAQSTRVNPATSKPDYAAFVGNTKTFLFDPSTDEGVTFSMQMPHSWAIGTNIEPHVHWAPTTSNTGNVQWVIECTSAAISGTFGSTTALTVTQAANGVAQYHHYADFDEYDMSSISTVSAMLECYLYRNADSDTYTGDAALLEVDFHFLSDTIGSNEEKEK